MMNVIIVAYQVDNIAVFIPVVMSFGIVLVVDII